jgi:AcrR family transcriptional regulator
MATQLKTQRGGGTRNQRRGAASPARRERAATAQARERALRATVGLVARRGVERVRLRDISRAAGVSIGSLQYYFETRDQLLQEAFAYRSQDAIRGFTEAAGTGEDPWQRIQAVVEHATRPRGYRERSTVWLEFAAASSRDNHLNQVMSRVYAAWREPLHKAIDEGTAVGRFCPVMPVEDVVDAIVTQIDGLELAIAARMENYSAARARKIILATARSLLGLRSEGAPPRPPRSLPVQPGTAPKGS